MAPLCSWRYCSPAPTCQQHTLQCLLGLPRLSHRLARACTAAEVSGSFSWVALNVRTTAARCMHGRDCEGVDEHVSWVADVLLRSVIDIHSWVLTSLAPQNLSHLQTPGAIRAQDSEQSGHVAPAVEIVLRLQVIPSISQVRVCPLALLYCFSAAVLLTAQALSHAPGEAGRLGCLRHRQWGGQSLPALGLSECT